MKFFLRLWVFLPLLVFVVTGCGKKADTRKPLEEIRGEVQRLSVRDLEAYAKAYAGEIQSSQGELDRIKSRLGELSPRDLFGEKAQGIKDEIAGVGAEISELTQRYQIYLQAYKDKGGDIAKVKIG